jgi:hypothetical protein
MSSIRRIMMGLKSERDAGHILRYLRKMHIALRRFMIQLGHVTQKKTRMGDKKPPMGAGDSTGSACPYPHAVFELEGGVTVTGAVGSQ